MNIVNDNSCSWINDLAPRSNIKKINTSKENLSADKAELGVLKYLNKINFGNALENYQNLILISMNVQVSANNQGVCFSVCS
tara:strand:+ start:1153 stop:1398 length:246 start_codon:yes stop_codon:yes gene_type:complete